jgi:Heavy metal binding domain
VNVLRRDTRPASGRVAAFRVVLLVLAAGALAAATVVGRVRDRAMSESAARYVCPMHPDVTASRPGPCPICGMELELVGVAGAPVIGPSTFQTYDFVRHRGLGLEIRAPAWIEADGAIAAIVYNDALATLTADEQAVFSPSTGAPGEGEAVEVRATLDASDAPLSWDRATSRVHFQVAPVAATAAPTLRPGEVGWVRMAGKRRDVEVIPFRAVLQGAEGPYVLVGAGDGRTLTKRPIEIGRVVGGVATVLSGLRLQERVLVRGAFFVDAERRLRRQSSVEVGP